MRKDMEEDDGGEEDEGGEEAEEEEEDGERARARERGQGTGSCESRGVELPYLVLAFFCVQLFSSPDVPSSRNNVRTQIHSGCRGPVNERHHMTVVA